LADAQTNDYSIFGSNELLDDETAEVEKLGEPQQEAATAQQRPTRANWNGKLPRCNTAADALATL
jgi:hypothetical protein